MLQVKTVLCPVDFSDATREGLAVAASVCLRFKARLVLQYDVAGDQATERNRELEEADEATRRLGELVSGLPAGIEAEWRLTQGPRRAAIVNLARELPADILVMVSAAGADPENSSVTEMVIEEAPCPVLAVRADGGGFPGLLSEEKDLSVVAAVDFTPHSESALSALLEMARTLPMKVHLVTAEPSKSIEDVRHGREEARTRLAAMVPPAVAASVSLGVLVGPPAREVLAEAKKRSADLIVVGVSLKDPVGKAVFGATSSDVLRQSPCPVWFVPEKARGHARTPVAEPVQAPTA